MKSPLPPPPLVTPDPRSTSAVCFHIVDDDASVRASLGAFVERFGMSWHGHGSGEEFLDAYDPASSACLLLDVGLPGMSGLDLLAELESRDIMLPTLVFSASAEVERVVVAIQRGAVGYQQKPPDPRRLLEHLRTMATQAPALARARAQASWLKSAVASLTPREHEVFRLMCAGRSAKQIAMELGLRGRTAHIHRTNVLRKLRVETALELVQLVGHRTLAFAR